MNFKFLTRQTLIILPVLLIGIFLRTWHLTDVPLGFSENEASIGYNAYSILKTGKDETGKLLPLTFESFGDYKSGLPIYLTTIFIKVIGLSELAVRLPAVIVGVISIILIYLVAWKLFENKISAFLTALLLSISPWGVQISRFDVSASLALLLILLMLFVMLSKIKFKMPILLLITLISLFTNVTCLFFIVPTFFYSLLKNGYKKKKVLLVLSIILIGFSVFLTKQSLQYFYIKNSFVEDIGFRNKINELRGFNSKLNLNFLGLILQNKFILFGDQVFKNYISGFDFYYLFSKNDFHEKYLVYDFGIFYSLELIFFVLGIFFCIKHRSENSNLLIFLLLLSPLPGVLSKRPDFENTLFFLIIPFYLLAAKGLELMLKIFLKLNVLLTFVLATLFFFTGFNFFSFLFLPLPDRSSKKLELWL